MSTLTAPPKRSETDETCEMGLPTWSNDARWSCAEAATYLGLTPASFTKWVADGRAPKPLPGTRRWDRKAIDLALDKISGIPSAPVSEEDQGAEALRQWLRDDEARNAARERDPKRAEGEAALAKRRGR